MEFVYYGPLPPSLVRQVFEGEDARHHGMDAPQQLGEAPPARVV
jgi:hypothetical protein